MLYESSYGIIPLRQHDGGWQVLLVQHQAGHWAFPKGHANKGETHQEAAERELEEETGLKVTSYLSNQTMIEKYMFRWAGDLISKRVTYFIAEVEGAIALQEKEIKSSRWLTLEGAEKKMSFREGKIICHQLKEILLKAES